MLRPSPPTWRCLELELRLVHRVRPSWWDQQPDEKRKREIHAWGKTLVKVSERVVLCKPGRCSPATKLAGTLILNLPGPRTVRNECRLFKPAGLPCSVMAAWAKTVKYLSEKYVDSEMRCRISFYYFTLKKVAFLTSSPATSRKVPQRTL